MKIIGKRINKESKIVPVFLGIFCTVIISIGLSMLLTRLVVNGTIEYENIDGYIFGLIIFSLVGGVILTKNSLKSNKKSILIAFGWLLLLILINIIMGETMNGILKGLLAMIIGCGISILFNNKRKQSHSTKYRYR